MCVCVREFFQKHTIVRELNFRYQTQSWFRCPKYLGLQIETLLLLFCQQRPQPKSLLLFSLTLHNNNLLPSCWHLSAQWTASVSEEAAEIAKATLWMNLISELDHSTELNLFVEVDKFERECSSTNLLQLWSCLLAYFNGFGSNRKQQLSKRERRKRAEKTRENANANANSNLNANPITPATLAAACNMPLDYCHQAIHWLWK